MYDALKNNKNAVIKYAVKCRKLKKFGWARVRALYNNISQSGDDKLRNRISRRLNSKSSNESTDDASLIEDEGNDKASFQRFIYY